MNTPSTRTLVLCLMLTAMSGLSQNLTNQLPPISSPEVLAPSDWQARPLDGFSTKWSRTIIVTNALTGEPVLTEESYIAVASGLNYLDSSGSGVWHPAMDQIDLMTNGLGGAGALRGQTKAYFPTTLGDAGSAITLISQKGTVLKIAPLAVYYVDDSTGASVLLAQMKSGVQGELVGYNQVVYRNAMQGGLNCDLRFTYTRGACEADLIINSQPIAPPETYSLDPNSTRLELVSAVTAPLPSITPIPTVGDLPDFALAYDSGALQFVQGYAFSVAGDPTDSSAPPPDAPAQVILPAAANSDDRVPVAKEFIEMPTPGQWGLGERVKWKDIEPKLQVLPPYQQQGALSTPEKHASLQRQWPVLDKREGGDSKPMKVATAAYRPKGVVWDWTTVNSGTSYWFSNSVTYYVAGLCSFTANVTFDPACTIKFTNGASLYLTGPVTCNGTTANPSVLTSLSDWGFGVRVPGGTGYQTYSAAQEISLNYTNSPQILNGLRFRWAQTGLYLTGPSGGGLTHTITNCVFEWCQTGIFTTNCTAAIVNSTRCTLGTDVAGNSTGKLSNVCGGNDPANGLPYSWEYEYFGTNGVSVSADPDGDGLSNQQELNDGTSPLASDLPQILEQPANQLIEKGYPVTFSVYGIGTGTLSYQWLYNGQSLASATNSSYTISNVQLTNTGNYSVWVTNTCGTNATQLSLLSSNAYLSVAVTNSGIPAQQGIISWWRGENNANDSAGTNNGTTSGAVGYSPGKVGQAFNFTNGLTGTVTVNSSSSLNFNTNADFSIEGWIQAQTATNNNYGVQSILDKRYAPDTSDSVGYAFYLVSGQLGCQLAQNPLTYLGFVNYGPAGPDLRGAFHHIAMTVSRVNPNGGALYVDGTNVLTFNPTLQPGDLTTTTNALLIGKHATPGLNCYFGGLIDELAIYNRALSTSDIQSLYNIGSAGKYYPPSAPVITSQPQSLSVGPLQSVTFSVGASGTTPFTYQWLFNGVAISGATASSYTNTSSAFATAETFAVIVANSGGSVVSSNATLTITNAAGLVAWWRAEGDARDAIGGNDGKLVGTGFASGEVGQTFSNQYYDYVQVPSSPALKLTNEFTVEFWYKDTGSEWYQVGLVGKCSPIAYNFDIVLWATNSLSMGFLDPTVGPQSLGVTPVPQANVFHHVAATYQQAGTNVQMQLYVDGTSQASRSIAGNLANTINDAPLSIGTILPTAGFFTGLIDEVSIYTNVLTANQISAIYNAGAAGKTLPPNTAPSMLLQPTNQTTSAGMDVLLSAQATGSAPLSYQWSLNGVAIAGATSRVYITNDVQPGTYTNSVVIANSFGSVTSSNAVLTVTSAPPCITAPSNIVGWWKADGTTRDEIGDDAGVLMDGVSYTNGMVNQGFNIPGFPAQTFVSIASSPALKLTNAFTIEFWYKDPNGSGGSYALVSKQQISGSCSSPYPAGNYLMAIAGADFYFQCWMSDPSSGPVGLDYWPVPVGQMFHHLAASFLQTNANITISLYIDGKPVLTNTVAGNLAHYISDTPLTIGAYDANGDGAFPGTIDEVAIYSRVLSASEIASIYNAGSKGKCFTSAAPAITTQPASQSVGAGSEVVMAVCATGTPQLTYQWQLDSAAIVGATNKTYIIDNAQSLQAGTYSVLVTNTFGSVLSQPAVLTITSPPACTPPPPNMVSWWRAEGNANDSIGSNNGIVTNGAGFGTGKVNEAFSFNGTGYVQVADSPSLHFTNALTAEFWYKDTGSTALCGLVSKASASFPSGTFAVALVPNADLAVYFGDATFGGQWLPYAPIPAPGMFHHVAVTYQQNGLNQVGANLYIDGQCARSGTFVGNLTNTFSSAPMVIGAFDSLGDWPFTGIIDELSLYNRALAASELEAIYNAGASGKCFNDMPYVTITSPTNSQTFREVVTVPITAIAYDENATITNVQFFAGTNYIGTATSNVTSWTFSWPGRTNGYYAITATATDTRGASNYSSSVAFVVNPTNYPPVVNITYPASNGVFAAGSDITITATATNGSNGGAVTNVAFFVNNLFIGNDPTNPYSITKCCWSPGTYILTAEAMDTYGSVGVTTNLITITVSGVTPSSGNGFWDPVFGNPGAPPNPFGLSAIKASGSTLYVAGFDANIGGTNDNGIHQWDGTNWSVLSCPGYDIAVYTVAVTGTNIYIGGGPANSEQRNIAQWTGSCWAKVGTNAALETDGVTATIWAVTLMGSDLYVAGDFADAGGDTNVAYVAKFDPASSSWLKVGNGLNGTVYSLASIGNTLFAAGSFTNAGNDPQANYVAQLSGGSWINVGGGVSGTNPAGTPGMAYALAVCGSNLFVGGDFTSAGGNTNANGIAEWNGSHWIPIQNGLVPTTTSNGPIPSFSVMSIAVQGKTLYAGGAFVGTRRGTNESPASCIAKAAWDEDTQSWTWTDLDQGLFRIGLPPFVQAVAIVPGVSPSSYDMYAAGTFDVAGSAQVWSEDIARWSVGRAYPSNIAPFIAMTAPANDSVFTNPPTSYVTFSAWATAGTATVSTVTFVVDTNAIVLATNSSNPYRGTWTSLSVGYHAVKAIVTDAAGFTNSSSPVVFQVVGTNNVLTAYNDFFTVFANSVQNYLPVLTNDISSSPMRIIDAGPSIGPASYGSSSLGTVSVSYNGSNIVYTPSPNVFGTNVLYYTVTNTSGAIAQALVTVKIATLPQVQITNPPDGLITNAGANLTISGTAFDWDDSIASVKLFTNGIQYATLTPNASGVWSTTWTQTNAGFYMFTASATDNDGYTNLSAPATVQLTSSSTNGLLPVANIYSASTGFITNNDALTGALMVTNGQLTVTGAAYDLDGEQVTWQFVLINPSNPGSAPLYNVTPGPLNSQGFHTSSVTNTAFPALDLSLVQNGCYQLTLNVRAGGDQATATLLIGVASNLKIGQFSFSEQDLSIPVNGIPITVTRTYNSINPNSSDFGYGWSFKINSMDVQIDEVRQNVNLNSLEVVDTDVTIDPDLATQSLSVRAGGGRDISLTLPNGRPTTFAFVPSAAGPLQATALWTNAPDVHASLTVQGSATINLAGAPSIMGSDGYPYDYADFPGWILQTADHTQYYIDRGQPVHITYDTTGTGSYVNAQVYGPPTLTRIIQRTGDKLVITSSGIVHYATNNPNVPTRSVYFDRDNQGRIIALHDPTSGSNGVPIIQYVYNQDTGNLIQAIKLTDRVANTAVTNKYWYTNSAFPHYITSIENGLGVPITRNNYDSSGRLISTTDANGNTTQLIHNLAANQDIIVDPLGHTNTYTYDSRGNVLSLTNALGGITTNAYDAFNNKIVTVAFANNAPYATTTFSYDSVGAPLVMTNALGFTNAYTYNGFEEPTTSVDARGGTTTSYYDANGNLTNTSDALSNSTTNFYDTNGLLIASVDAVGAATTNFFDGSGNLLASSVYGASSSGSTILSTNTFGYDANGNRTSSTNWRRVSGSWFSAATTYIYDARNRLIQTINPDGGSNTTVYDAAGRIQATIDPRGYATTNVYDYMGHLVLTIYPDSSTNSFTYDANGNRLTMVDQNGRLTTYNYDGLNRVTNTVYADNSSSQTAYDDLGRVKYTIDSRGATNAFGYDAVGNKLVVTNAWGTTAQTTNGFGFDGNGNQTFFFDGLGRKTSYTFDILNRQGQVQYPDNTTTFTGYDGMGRRTAETNQDAIVSVFGYDGLGRLLAVTNGIYSGQITNWAQYQYDEAGNLTTQIDALNRQTSYQYDSMGHRTKRTLPGIQFETFGYDLAGNLTRNTNCNGVIITNIYDALNRLTNRSSANGYSVVFGYSATSQRTNMVDPSGNSVYTYDLRDRLLSKAVTWSNGLTNSLNYRYDANGNLTNLWSGRTGGVTNFLQYDAQNRLTNVVASGTTAAGYGYDLAGNLQAMSYGNNATNLYQYDALNRLTNLVWQLSNTSTNLASFFYKLGATGNRTNLNESFVGTGRTNAWIYDSLYRLKQETFTGGIAGTLSYVYDPVSNRTNRSSTVSGLTNQTCVVNPNDWLTNTDTYDSNGNTLTSFGNSYQYDPLSQVTNVNSSITLGYDGDGNRVSKTANGTNFFYLVADQNPSGYPQVLEEWTVVGTSTNLNRFYNYGLQLVSQNQGGTINYFVQDGHGSTRLLLTTAGAVNQWFVFDAYGNLIASNATPVTSILYSGGYLDFSLGLYQPAHRVLNQTTGRFLTADPEEGSQEEPKALHRYLYALADPVNGSDPLGLSGETDDTRFGRAIERVIRQDFYGKDSDYRGDITKSLGSLLGMPTKGDLRQFVDLYHRQPNIPGTTGTNYIFEIKPIGAYFSGYRRIRKYLGVLHRYNYSWRRGNASDYYYWNDESGPIVKSDVNGFPLPGGKWAVVMPPVLGVITYVKIPPVNVYNVFYTATVLGVLTGATQALATPASLTAAGTTMGELATTAPVFEEIGAFTIMDAEIGIATYELESEL